MVSPAVPEPGGAPVPPAADPEAIRARLSSSLVAEFDREWGIVLERAKQGKTLEPVHSMLAKWRHLAYPELRNPGAYYRLLAQAEQGLRTGRPPEGSVSGGEIKALTSQRLERQA
ncbi:MAG TPA: DUF6247 family protein [Pseudonocardia sp.]|uniref:DUF6247 family protein n=1 Tax=Pseudonocardia sp. TaxID=60912 RepID=UPI002F41C8FA